MLDIIKKNSLHHHKQRYTGSRVYEYLKEKKKRQKDILWKNIQEDEPTNEEVEIINNYIQNDSNDTISLDDLAKDLGINE